jgi:hypothetical protein
MIQIRLRSFLLACGLGLLALAPAACGSSSTGGGGGGGPISTGTMTGKVGGTAWTFMAGESDSFLSDATNWYLNLYDVAIDTPCSGGTPAAATRSLILKVPRAVGTYPLSLTMDRTETFYIVATNDNFIATSGSVQLVSSNTTTINGAAKFQYNADNSVDGQFTANICP